MSDFNTMLRDGADLYPRRPRKSTVAVMPDQRIAVYVGTAYQYLTLGQATNLREQLARAIDAVRNREIAEVAS